MHLMNYSLDNIKELETALYALGLEAIINRPYLQRLRDIRLLGTMEYVEPLKRKYSRYEHSLAVAYLMSSAVKALRLSDLACQVAVIAGLLHDVGHTALSHAAEVFLLRRQDKFHEDHSRTIMTMLSKELSIIHEEKLAVEVQLASDLLSGRLLNSAYRKLSDGKFIIGDDEIIVLDLLATGAMSIDMIEGVTRTARSIGLIHPDPLMFIHSLRRKNHDVTVPAEIWPSVWELFELERKIYDEYIYSAKGMAAEAMLTRALELAFPGRNQSLKDRRSEDSQYDLTYDFLNMTDQQVIDHIQSDPAANDILQKLENRDLFISLFNVSPKVHDDMLNYMSVQCNNEERKISIENALASHLGLDPRQVIVHSTIRKKFKFDRYEALRLFSENSPYSEIETRTYSEIRRQFRTERISGTLLDVFIPNALPDDFNNFSLSEPELIAQTGASPVVSKRFNMQKDKKNGMVATSQEVADFLAMWAIRSPSDIVLDPSCGDGVFLNASWNRLTFIGASRQALGQVYGVERQPGSWQDIRDLWQDRIIHRDFFEIRAGEHPLPLVDVVVGNPPYVRGHRFKGENRERALKAGDDCLTQTLGEGAKLTQGSNAWAPFLLHACTFLGPLGRLAMVLPTELLTADYAKPVREFLTKKFSSLSFVLFRKRIFDQEQDALLLLADSGGKPGIFRIEIDSSENLNEVMTRMVPAPHLSDIWLAGKWTALLTNQEVLDLLDSLCTRNLATKLESVARVRIGLVTGDSHFFVLKPSEAEHANLKNEWLIPIVAKANQIPGAVLTQEDLDELQRTDSKYLLLRIPPDADLSLDPNLRRYVESGRSQGIHSLQKCRTRWPWYSVPYSALPDLFLTYMSGKRCRLCLNAAQINCTNNIHQLFIKDKKFANVCVASFYSSLTGLSIELAGRGYGGGLIKLDPGDAKMLLMPNLESLAGSTLASIEAFLPQVDAELRTNPNDGIWEGLDELILSQTLGLSVNECRIIQQEYTRLRNRRMNRT
jgi:adenine-specific DNA-methyltransferase